MARAKSLENDPLFFSIKRETGIARKIFDHIFKRKIKSTLLEEWFEKSQLQFSRYSLNKTSILMYEKNLNLKENSLHFIFLCFLFEIEKTFRTCMSLNEILRLIEFPIEEFRENENFNFEVQFQLPIYYEFDSIYFKMNYLAEIRLADSINNFEKKQNGPEKKLNSNPIQNIFNKPLNFIENYCEQEDLAFIKNLLDYALELNHKILIITPDHKSFYKIRFFLKLDEAHQVKTIFDVSYNIKKDNFKKIFQIVIVYEAQDLDLLQLDFLFFHFQDIKSLILIGNPYEEFYGGKFIFSQFFQLKQFVDKVTNYSKEKFQTEALKDIFNQVKTNQKIDFLQHQKYQIKEIKEGFHFVDASKIENKEQFIYAWLEKFKNQKSVVVSNSSSGAYSLNEKIREIYQFQTETINSDEPVIFIKNDLESNFYKGHFTRYKNLSSGYKNLIQTAYVISLDLAFCEDWNNLCLFLEEDDFSVESLNIYSIITSIFFKMNHSLTLLTNKDNLKKLSYMSLGTSNLMKRIIRDKPGMIEKFPKYLKDSPIINSLIDTSNILENNLKSGFILREKNVSFEAIYKDYLNSGLKKTIIFIPGLFNSEKVWIAKEKKFGIASELEKYGYYPIFLRFNPGLNIYQNGEYLSKHLNEIYEIDPNFSYSIICYSQGGLLLRSALYSLQERETIYDWSKNINKAIFIACPDKGSYLEKIGCKVIDGVSYLPILGTQFFTLITNLRSSAMKDLSYGLIRKEDSQASIHNTKKKQLYFGELDKIDGYQIYSLILKNKYLNWMGDGIVERSSLEYLLNPVFRKKKESEKRSICLEGLSHIEIIYSPRTVKAILSCLKI